MPSFSPVASEFPDLVPRRFSLLDAMILIAAIGVGLMVPRAVYAITSMGESISNLFMSDHTWMTIGTAWLLIASMTLALMVVFSPRASGTGRYRRPGAIAMFMVVLTWVVCLVRAFLSEMDFLVNHGEIGFFFYFDLIIRPVQQTASEAGLAIIAGWLTLKLIGQRNSGRDGLDRSCFVLGWIWVLSGLFHQVLARWVPW